MDIKVSIIVPVYNTEDYLTSCLESLVNQSLEEIEIILINDCSTDGSINILNEYKNKYQSKIKLINLEDNKGPGGARNEGINIAKGQYLGFVDSDDYVSNTMFEELYTIACKENYDMVDCGFYHEGFDENMKTTIGSALGTLTLEKRKELFVHSGFIWSKIIRRNIITHNNIKFRENVAYEDIDFIRIVMFYCQSICATDKTLYYHRENCDSITNQFTEDIQVYEKMDSMRSLVETFKNLNVYNDYKDEITYLIYKTYMVVLEYNVTLPKEEINLQLFKELHDFFFELVDYDYQSNKYIIQIDKEARMLAEVNNIDYKELISICSNL